MKKFIAKKPEKEVISLRIPSEILKIIDKKATEVEISRNELINQMILYSLQNMDDSSKET
ncbi:MAG: ribbon-helix-helix protein, CopG family [Dorea longicatena]